MLLLNEARTEARSRQKALEKSSQTIPELKLLLEKSERQRGKLILFLFCGVFFGRSTLNHV